jgi:hypothetical protein
MEPKTLLTTLTSFGTLDNVQTDTLSLVRFIDQTILKHEKEIAKLRKARAVLVVRDTEPQHPQELDTDGIALPDRDGPWKPDSIGGHLMAVLQQERQPIGMKTIHEKISARGKLVEYHTLTSMVAYYMRRGYVARTGPNKYRIAPAPEVTNGASVPKNGRP